MLRVLVIAAVPLTAVGCGPTCQSTCNRLYQESECGIQAVGDDSVADLTSRCMDECENALEIPGEVGDYTPDEYTPSSETVTLQNDKQAALWMDCVSETACEYLEEGYCAPVWQ